VRNRWIVEEWELERTVAVERERVWSQRERNPAEKKFLE
jgi:hypothetical protein